MNILIPAPGEIHHDDLILFHGRRQLCGVGQGVTGFQRRDDAFDTGQGMKAGQRLVVGDGDLLGATAVLQPGVLGTDSGIVETGGYGMGLDDLTIVVFHEIGAIAM
jgi:hypothetical protein